MQVRASLRLDYAQLPAQQRLCKKQALALVTEVRAVQMQLLMLGLICGACAGLRLDDAQLPAQQRLRAEQSLQQQNRDVSGVSCV